MTGQPAPPARHGSAVGRTAVVAHVGAVAGLAGVLLAATTTIWPTMVLSLRMPEVGEKFGRRLDLVLMQREVDRRS